MPRVHEIIESWVGTFFATLLSIMGLMVAILVVLIDASWERAVGLMAVLSAIWFWLNGRHLSGMWRAVQRGEHPAAVVAAVCQRPPPLLLRPLVAVWWLIYFAIGVAFILMMEAQMVTDAETGGAPVLVLAVFLAFMYAYVANAYMLMAVAAFTSNARIIRRVWGWRVMIDLGLVGLSLLLPPELFRP
jgi:hypothetical protein